MAAPKILETIKLNNKKVKASTKVANETIENIRELIIKRTKVKKDVFTRTQIMQKRQSENRRRLTRETVLEAPNFVKTPLGRQSLTTGIAQTGKGFLERIVSFLGYLAAGWILSNLPTWIAMAKEFIARIKRLKEIVGSVVSGVGNFFSGIKGVLDAFTANLLNLDLFDTSKRMDKALKDLSSTVDGIGRDIEEGFEIITTPITEGKYSGEEIPETGTPSQDEGAYPSPTPPPQQQPSPSGNISNNQRQALNILSKYESASSGGYNAVNQIGIKGGRGVLGYSGDFRNMKQHGGKALTNMSIAEIMELQAPRPGMSNREWIRQGRLHAVGRYQFIGMTLPGVVKRSGIPTTAKFTPEVQDLLALQYLKEAGIGAWVGPADKATKQERAIIEAARKEPINYRPSVATASPQAPKPKAQQESKASTPTIPRTIKPIVTSRYGVQRGARTHGGTDLAVDEGTALRAISDGVIVDSDFERGWGNFLVMKDNLGIYHLYGHMRPGYKRGGTVRRGEKIGEVGMTGRTDGPHLHWEAGTGWNKYVITGKFDPLNKYSMYAPFNTQPDSKTSPASFTKPQQTSTKPTAITPQRRGQDVVIIDDTRPTQQTTGGGGGYSPPQGQSNAFSALNNFIKNKLLVGLSFL